MEFYQPYFSEKQPMKIGSKKKFNIFQNEVLADFQNPRFKAKFQKMAKFPNMI